MTELLARRIRLAEAAGRHKSQGGDELFDLGREAAVVRSAAELATEHGLDAEAVREVFWRIVKRRGRHSSTPRMREHSAIDLDDLA
ncbi:MAG TPA: chorismate mutase [Longimicrobiales bacterium]|nr:chorismate mutase [Longimicrobiales bacterium]